MALSLIFRGLLSAVLLCIVTSLQAAPVILVIGDSLSAAHQIPVESGWVALMAAKLKKEKPEATIINASVSGDMTIDAEQRLPGLLEKYHPTIVIIELGSNDALAGKIFFIKPSLMKMIQMSKDAQAKVVLIGMKLPPNLGKFTVELFSQIMTEVASSTGSAFVPFLLEGVAEDDSKLLSDRIHPNEKAGPTLLNNVWPAVQGLLGS